MKTKIAPRSAKIPAFYLHQNFIIFRNYKNFRRYIRPDLF